MTGPVHILATVRKARLLEAARLVFRTLRTGFPTAEVCVWGNGLEPAADAALRQSAASVGARYANVPRTSHDVWIEELVRRAEAPFWICDTDMVFFEDCERFPVEARTEGYGKPVLCLGRWEPGFEDEVTGCEHVERLHTCLMWFDPERLRSAMRAEMARVPLSWRQSAEFGFVRQQFLVLDGRRVLYDTCTGIWQAGLGTRFSAKQDCAFEHLHCGTWLDEAEKRMGCGPALAEMHQRVYADPAAARGLQRQQKLYYESRKRI